MLRKLAVLALLIKVALVQLACGGSVLVKRPKHAPTDRAITALWVDEIRHIAKPGDILLSRSYSLPGDIIAVGTSGEDLSHAALWDAERGVVIEAITPRVHTVSLDKFVHRNRYIILVRPRGLTDAQRVAAVERARGAIGLGFDVLGMLGINDRDDKYYCTELVADAIGGIDAGRIITPNELMEYGDVVYFSGLRDAPQVQEQAVGRYADVVSRYSAMQAMRGAPAR